MNCAAWGGGESVEDVTGILVSIRGGGAVGWWGGGRESWMNGLVSLLFVDWGVGGDFW